MNLADRLEMVGDLMLVRQLPDDQVSPGGIVLPETQTQQGVKRAEVIIVGPGVWGPGCAEYKEMQPQVGDIIWWRRGQLGNEAVVTELDYEGQRYVVIPEAIVLLIEKRRDGQE